MRATTQTTLATGLTLLVGAQASAAIVGITETFDTGIADNGVWTSVGAVAPAIAFDSNSANDFDKFDRIDTQVNALDGDGIVGNLAGDDEATGDGLLNDGGLRFNTANAVPGDEAIGLTVGGTMDPGEIITLVLDYYNDNGSFYSVDLQLYNVTDGVVLASTGNQTVRGGNQNVDATVSYRPSTVTLNYTALASDAGDTLQIRLVENANNTARDPYVDSYTLSSVPEPGSFALLALGGMSMLRRRR